MTNQTIYETALALLGEPGSSTEYPDYQLRTPLLLPILFSRLSTISACLGKSVPAEAPASLSASFPLADLLAPVAAEMLASMLIFDEFPELSAKLSEAAENDLQRVGGELPASDIGSTREVYGL